jgi:hypothetical protein
MPKTPQEAANLALAAIDPSTEVTTSGSAKVAGRAAYELTLKPKDKASLLGQITLAIDAEKHVPLRVQVYPAGSDKTAFEAAFTQVSFARPDAAQFTFTPPKGAKITEGDAEGGTSVAPKEPKGPAQRADMPEPVAIGTGWTTVLVARASSDAASAQGALSPQMFPSVSGAWGSGHLVTSRLFSVLFTDDGRVLAGAVHPDRLYQAATDPAAVALKAK